ncbi:hypothetical protein BD779DRAFT_1680130 [Infundibulicybe gibba]|nr:hypothetical protein BD779DRAFT_1680130 [Infundibulicybe gibba]
MSSIGINLDRTLGVLFLGSIVASMLYGIICIQAFVYLRREREKGKVVYKRLIFVLWLLDTTHLAFIVHALYHYMITYYGKPSSLESPTWSMLAQIYVTCTSDLAIRFILARRSWYMTGRNILLTLCIVSICVHVATRSIEAKDRRKVVPDAGMTSRRYYPLLFRAENTDMGKFFQAFRYLLYLGLGSGVVADCTIAVTLSVTLWRSRTGFPRTNSIVNTLVLYTINTGEPPNPAFSQGKFPSPHIIEHGLHVRHSFCSLSSFISFAIRPHDLIFMGFFFLLSKCEASRPQNSPLLVNAKTLTRTRTLVVYLNSLLAILNRQDSPVYNQAAVPTPWSNVLANAPVRGVRQQTKVPHLPHMSPAHKVPPIVVDITQHTVSDSEARGSSCDAASSKAGSHTQD